jgi:hypothetical protein
MTCRSRGAPSFRYPLEVLLFWTRCVYVKQTLPRPGASATATPSLCCSTSPVVKLAGVKATIAGDAPSVNGPLWRGREVVHGRKRVPRLRQNQKLVEIDVRVPLTAYLELLVSEEDAAAVGVLRCKFVGVEVLQHLVAKQQHLQTTRK